MSLRKFLFSALFLFSFFACVRAPIPVTRPEEALEPVSWGKTEVHDDDLAFKDVADAARRSMEYYKKLPQNSVFVLGPDRVGVQDMIVTLQNFLLIAENASLTAAQKVDRIKKDFVVYQSVGAGEGGKVTGWKRLPSTALLCPLSRCLLPGAFLGWTPRRFPRRFLPGCLPGGLAAGGLLSPGHLLGGFLPRGLLPGGRFLRGLLPRGLLPGSLLGWLSRWCRRGCGRCRGRRGSRRRRGGGGPLRGERIHPSRARPAHFHIMNVRHLTPPSIAFAA